MTDPLALDPVLPVRQRNIDLDPIELPLRADPVADEVTCADVGSQ